MKNMGWRIAGMARMAFGLAMLPAILLALAAVGTGCDEKDYHHDPAAGKGALIVDNRTGDDIRVHVDGVNVMEVDGLDDDAVDLDPGEYRVILIQRKGDREHGTYVDILEGERTVMVVELRKGSLTEYDVTVDFD